MSSMMLQVMKSVRNFFDVSSEAGEFETNGGGIWLSGTYAEGQYILLTGDGRVSGVYKIATVSDGLYAIDPAPVDLQWKGAVYGLAVPPAFVELCEEIQRFRASSGKPSAYMSESLSGAHSYTRAVNPTTGAMIGWKTAFADDLAQYRKSMTYSIDI